jgi:protein-S-isoprenylcysteine O-methyltransferase Ste14
MSAPEGALPPGEGHLTEWLLRAFALLIYGVAVWNIARGWWADPTRWTLLLLLLTEGYTLVLVLIARRASARDMTPLAILTTGYAAFFFVLLTPDGTTHLVPEAVGIALQLAGMGWQIASKVTLGRSFGLLPATRRIVVAGPYRVVRHPIYLGYLIGHIGFLAANFSWRNLAVIGLLYVAQVIRIRREEGLLCQDGEYRDYVSRVRWRLLPGVY